MLASQATTAYALKKAWPELTLHIVPDAGHSSREPGTAKLLVEVSPPMLMMGGLYSLIAVQATDSFASL